MPRIEGTTNAQSKFLRALRKHGDALAADQWPSAVMLRRWMRQQRFRQAMRTLREAQRFRADLQLLGAATRASQELHARVLQAGGTSEALAPTAILSLMRLAHQRGGAECEPTYSEAPMLTRKRQEAERRAALEARRRKEEEAARRQRWYDSDMQCDFADFEKAEDPDVDDPDDDDDDDLR